MRRSLLLIALLAAQGVYAQAYPTGPVKLIVPFPPEGSVDMVARAVATRLGDSLGKPVVVDNRAGASGNIGAEIAAKSPADGHTLFVASSGVLATNIHLYKKTGFDPFKDFTPVIRTLPYVKSEKLRALAITELRLDPIGETPQAMAGTITQDSAMYGKIIKAAGIEPQ